ncbi:MAG: electron transfer flavoprotein subunit beta/FixA family protein [Deltaproteobacteria bacterium]|nr:electron transfer flavoprotein subunit beta/FixA family protein [Deltaproteobacteria bacterium]
MAGPEQSTNHASRGEVMHIVVCVKELIDPELPPENFKVDPGTSTVAGAGRLPFVLNPFDEQAVEAALRIKDALGARVTVLSLGHEVHLEVLKKPLTMGADELILLQHETYAFLDSSSIAWALAKAIEKVGDVDLVLCGRQAADWDAGQVGLGVARLLGLPAVTTARKIDVLDGKARVERVTGEGYEVVEVALPALVTVSNELGQARYPIMAKLLEAARKKPTVWGPEELGFDLPERQVELLELFQPVHEGSCEIAEGENPEEAAVNLARRLRQEKLL